MVRPARVLARPRQLKRSSKENGKNAEYAFLSIVDATNGCSWILLCGGKEVALARVALAVGESSVILMAPPVCP